MVSAFDDTAGRSWRPVLVQAIPLAAIVLFAVELRLIFRTGMVHIDSLNYAHVANDLVHGIGADALPRWFTGRIGLYGPVALFYAVFGANGVTTFAWPFLCSLFGIVCAYGIGRKLSGEVAGLLAAFLWAVLPADVAAATALLGDGPIAALGIGAVFFLLLAESARGLRLVAALAVSLACLLIGIVNKPSMLLLVVFLLVYVVWTRPRNRLVWLGLGAALIVGLLGYAYFSWNTYYQWGPRDERGLSAVLMRTRLVYWNLREWQGPAAMLKTLAGGGTDWWSNLVMGAPEFSWITPLWMAATATLLALRRREAYVPLLWFWSMFLWLSFGTRSFVSYTPITTSSMGPALTRHFLLLAAPPTIATGIYLAQGLRPAAWRWLIPAFVLVIGVVAWVGTRHAANLSLEVTRQAAADLPFAALSAGAVGLVVLGSVISPLFATGPAALWKSIAMAVLLLAIGFGSLNLSYQAATKFTLPWATTFPEAVEFLKKEPPLPIFVQNPIFGLQLDYASQFAFGFDAEPQTKPSNARIRVAPDDPNAVGDAYVLVDDFVITSDYDHSPRYLKDPPASWAEIARYGDRKGYQLHVYRVARAVPPQALEAAVRAAQTDESPRTLRRLLEVAANAKDYCLAARTWARQRAIAASSIRDFDPVKILSACYSANPEVGSSNMFVNGEFSKGVDGWTQVPAPGVEVVPTRDAQTGEPLVQVTSRSMGQRPVLIQNARVLPESAYVFEATLRTTAEIVTLYWESDVGRFQSEGTYPNWTTVRSVFVTPRWAGEPRTSDFFPFLLKGPGQVWLKNVKLAPLHLDAAK